MEAKYNGRLKIIELNSKHFDHEINNAMIEGYTLIISKIEESLNNNLKPLISFQNQRLNAGKIHLWNNTLNCHPDFNLILLSKLPHAHFKTEIQTETTIINFSLTKDSFEEIILSSILIKERPDLEKSRFELVKQNNDFKIILNELENDILIRVSKAQSSVLDDKSLVENFEKTKFHANQIELKQQEVLDATLEINTAREFYRPVAKRGIINYLDSNKRFLN